MSRKSAVSNEDFVLACINGKTVKEVAEAIDRTVETVRKRAKELRDAGVNIPTFSMTPKQKVSDEELVAAYNNADSMNDVAQAVGLKIGTVRARVTQLRKNGNDLPKFARKNRANDIDVAALQALIDQN